MSFQSHCHGRHLWTRRHIVVDYCRFSETNKHLLSCSHWIWPSDPPSHLSSARVAPFTKVNRYILDSPPGSYCFDLKSFLVAFDRDLLDHPRLWKSTLFLFILCFQKQQVAYYSNMTTQIQLFPFFGNIYGKKSKQQQPKKNVVSLEKDIVFIALTLVYKKGNVIIIIICIHIERWSSNFTLEQSCCMHRRRWN